MAEIGSITVKLKVEVDQDSLDAAIKLIADRLSGTQAEGNAPVVQLRVDGKLFAQSLSDAGNRVANQVMYGARHR